MMRLLGVFALLAWAVAAQSSWKYGLDDLCGTPDGSVCYYGTDGMWFERDKTTRSMFSKDASQVIIESLVYDQAQVNHLFHEKLKVRCIADCNGECGISRVTCSVPREDYDSPPLEVIDSVIICEDENGTPFVFGPRNTFYPGTCFVKVSLVDHTLPDWKKQDNPMRATTIAADRASLAVASDEL